MAKDNTSLQMAIFTKVTFTKGPVKEKEDIYGAIKAVTKEIGKETRCTDMVLTKPHKAFKYKDGFKMTNSLDRFINDLYLILLIK